MGLDAEAKSRRFLNMLENEPQIVRQKDNLTAVPTTTNWHRDQKTNRRRQAKRTADEQQTDTNKNDKNEKKGRTFSWQGLK